MKIGSIRVSTQEQNEALQVDALKDAGCEKFFTDKSTGAKFERKGLEETLASERWAISSQQLHYFTWGVHHRFLRWQMGFRAEGV